MVYKVTEGVELPDSMRGQPNGRLDPARLVPVIEGKSWKMLDYAARQMRGFFADVKVELGYDLTFIPGSASAYRDYARQRAMFFERFEPGPGKVTRTFDGVVYRLKAGMALAATPGKSNHGWGVAGDLCHVGGRAITGIERAKMRPIAARWGIADPVRTENWHWSVQRELATPAMKPVAGIVAAFAPSTPHTDLPSVKEGDRGDVGTLTGEAIRYLEWALATHAGQQLTVDGIFDAATTAAVKNLQAWVGREATGVVDVETWGVVQWVVSEATKPK